MRLSSLFWHNTRRSDGVVVLEGHCNWDVGTVKFWLVRNSGDPGKVCLLTELCSKRRKLEKPKISKIEHIRQNLYDIHEKLYKRSGCTAKPAEEALNARLASSSIVEWVIFLRTKRKERCLGKTWQLYKPKLRVNQLRVIRIHKVCESMRFDSGPEVFVRVNRNYVLTESVLTKMTACETADLSIVPTSTFLEDALQHAECARKEQILSLYMACCVNVWALDTH